MPKILGQSGISLADMYDVEGSVAGVERLNSEEVFTTHDLASTIFAERYSERIVTVDTGDVAQSLTIAAAVSDFPAVAIRILAIQVLTETVSDLSRVAVMARFATGLVDQEIPIWVWDGSSSIVVRIVDGGTQANHTFLIPDPTLTMLPSMLTGADQPEQVTQLVLRGLHGAFGAGTNKTSLRVLVGFAGAGGLNSRGVPFPGW